MRERRTTKKQRESEGTPPTRGPYFLQKLPFVEDAGINLLQRRPLPVFLRGFSSRHAHSSWLASERCHVMWVCLSFPLFIWRFEGQPMANGTLFGCVSKQPPPPKKEVWLPFGFL